MACDVQLDHGDSDSESDENSDVENMEEENSADIENMESENAGYIQYSQSKSLPSCILADVFHEMDKVGYTISKKHSLHRHLVVAFSDTMLVPDKKDKKLVEAYLKEKDVKWDYVWKSSPAWLWKRMQRYIPDENLLHCILEKFFDAWSPVKCSVTQQPLFTIDSWKKVKSVLHDTKKGWISDPQRIPLYTFIGHDQHGLLLYHCIRGTNSVEGGVHNPIQ